MPIPLRNYYYSRLVKTKENEKKEMEKAQGSSTEHSMSGKRKNN